MRLFILILWLTVLNLTSIAQNKNNDYIQGSQGLCNGVSINISYLLDNRTPSLDQIRFNSNVALPTSCLNNLNEKLQVYVDEYFQVDKNNLQSIINNYCSHMHGWVEYQPGTCQAGGPPPICPVKHWYQNPSKSMDEFYAERNKIFNKRLQELQNKKRELFEESCNCWVADLQRTHFKGTVDSKKLFVSDKTESHSASTIKVPCLNGECPIGFKCLNGYCVPSGAQSLATNTGIDPENIETAIDHLKDLATDKVLDVAAKQFRGVAVIRNFISTISGSPTYTVITGIAKTTMIGTYSSIYQKELVSVQSDVNDLKLLYDQENRYRKGLRLTTANYQERRTNIAKIRSRIGKSIFNLNNALDGIIREKELGQCNCYNVLSYTNTVTISSLTELISINIP